MAKGKAKSVMVRVKIDAIERELQGTDHTGTDHTGTYARYAMSKVLQEKF